MNATRVTIQSVALLLILSGAGSASDWGIYGVTIASGPGERTTSPSQPSGVSAPDGAGGAYVAWIDSRSGTPAIYVQRITADGGQTPGWPGNGLPVNPPVPFAQEAPSLTPDPAGGCFVAWSEGSTDSAMARVRVSRLGPNGVPKPGWPVDGVVVDVNAMRYATAVVADASGGVFVVFGRWTEVPVDLVVHHVLGNGALDPLAPPSGAIVGQSGYAMTFTAIPDGAGGMLMSWDEVVGTPTGVGTDYRAQRIVAPVMPAPGWGPNGVLIQSTNTGTGTWRTSSVASDGSGGAIVAFRQVKPAESHYGVYARRVRANGEFDAAWPAGGASATALPPGVGRFHAVTDAAGGVFLAFEVFESGSFFPPWRVWLQRMTLSGAVAAGWPVAGRLVGASDRGSLNPVALADGAGGAFVTWAETPDVSGGGRLHAHHVLGDGSNAPGWGTEGVELASGSPTEYQQDGVSLAQDAAHGLYAFWSDNGTTAQRESFRIIGQHITSPTTGTPDPPAGPGNLHVHPNPVFASATVRLRMPSAATVSVEVLDVTGRHVRQLATRSSQPAGEAAWSWDLLDDRGLRVRPGVYRVVTFQDGERATAPIVVMR